MANSNINTRERGSYTGERTKESPFQTAGWDINYSESGFTLNRKLAIVRLATQPNDSDTITIGNNTYTFKTNPSTAAHVEIGNMLKEGTFNRGGFFWTNYGHWTIGGNKATHTAGTGYTDALEQNWYSFPSAASAESSYPSPQVTAGTTYVLGFTIDTCTGGSVTPYIGNTAGTTRSADGTYANDSIIAANSDSLKFVPTADFNGKISAITVTVAGSDLKAITAQTLVKLINADNTNCKCSALYNALGYGTAYIILIAEDRDITPTLTVDGARIIKLLNWTLTITEAMLQSTNYWHKDNTADGDAKPVELTERNSGTKDNFLY